MDKWFKARLIWKGAFDSLSDAEAGRLAKALWRYANSGKREDLSGKETGAYGIFVETLSGDTQRNEDISSKRSKAGSAGAESRWQSMANDGNCYGKIANIANAINKKKNKNIDPPPPHSSPSSIPFADDEELIAIQEEQNEIFNLAKEIGLPATAYNLKQIERLHSEYGKERLVHGLGEAARLNKVSIGYIESVAKNYGTPKPAESDAERESEEMEALYQKTERMLADIYGEG